MSSGSPEANDFLQQVDSVHSLLEGQIMLIKVHSVIASLYSKTTCIHDSYVAGPLAYMMWDFFFFSF